MEAGTGLRTRRVALREMPGRKLDRTAAAGRLPALAHRSRQPGGVRARASCRRCRLPPPVFGCPSRPQRRAYFGPWAGALHRL